jgi:hypothetical protein
MNNSRKAKLLGWKQYYSGIIYRHVDKIKSRVLSEMIHYNMSNTAERGGNGATKTDEQTRNK